MISLFDIRKPMYQHPYNGFSGSSISPYVLLAHSGTNSLNTTEQYTRVSKMLANPSNQFLQKAINAAESVPSSSFCSSSELRLIMDDTPPRLGLLEGIVRSTPIEGA
jgi:hypothetical protein